ASQPDRLARLISFLADAPDRSPNISRFVRTTDRCHRPGGLLLPPYVRHVREAYRGDHENREQIAGEKLVPRRSNHNPESKQAHLEEGGLPPRQGKGLEEIQASAPAREVTRLTTRWTLALRRPTFEDYRRVLHVRRWIRRVLVRSQEGQLEQAQSALVGLELLAIAPPQRRILQLLPQQAVADRERVDLRAHETAERILRLAHDRLTAHVEARVHEHRASGHGFESRQQRVEPRVGFPVHGLDTRRVIDVRRGRNVRTRNVQLVDAEQRLLLGGHCPAPALDHPRRDEHVRAVAVQLEPVGNILPQHRRREGPERLAKFHFQIQLRL